VPLVYASKGVTAISFSAVRRYYSVLPADFWHAPPSPSNLDKSSRSIELTSGTIEVKIAGTTVLKSSERAD
jgi:hypothetical protein